MLNFRLSQSLVKPSGRAPRLNLAHPLCNQKNILFAAVAKGAGFLDLVSGAYATNAAVSSGIDMNGPWASSTTSTGTGAVSFPAPNVSYQFMTWGIIFRWTILAVSTQFPLSFGSPANTGLVVNATNGISFYLINSGLFTLPVTIGNGTYFCFMSNAVGTASLQRTMVIVNLTTGQIWITKSASINNINPTPSFILLNPVSNVNSLRLYAAFVTGSVLVPPAVNPAATFYSIDQVMGGIQDPWGLWYA